eukprot:CAMPEP_0119103750 /NCGR_PEP_ID=MMETSP1180-20130426/2127_1 /TAXON_ID=3052 ORGANISM="Chlamydomonas cf sp, Strain CCMP681" /NCGR_SAMPLE_ID=MMETSP1180 /ASSEMBLY_ACC=CAM_ASM_000741 /LENGTH=305 /DNA_ID=CAMNT_0007088329 /DNA_START=27 /DNA_END=944 /DNA_ORIENTATION=-
MQHIHRGHGFRNPIDSCQSHVATPDRPARMHPVLNLRQVCANSKAKEEDSDLVTRWVGKIFGKSVLEDRAPMGIKRMDWSTVKDLDVVLDRVASPVSSDDAYMATLRPMLAGTSLEEEPLRCAFSATEDGWRAGVFQAAVAGYGPCLVLVRTKGGAVCGGYNPLGFDGQGADKASMGAFVFTWPSGDTRTSVYKLPKVGTDQLAVLDRPDFGPQFGPGDLKIPLVGRGNDPANKATSKLVDYARPPGGAKSLFAKEEGGKTELVEMRAYVRKGGKLKFELDGVRWKSSLTDDETGEGPPTGIFGM